MYFTAFDAVVLNNFASQFADRHKAVRPCWSQCDKAGQDRYYENDLHSENEKIIFNDLFLALQLILSFVYIIQSSFIFWLEPFVKE